MRKRRVWKVTDFGAYGDFGWSRFLPLCWWLAPGVDISGEVEKIWSSATAFRRLCRTSKIALTVTAAEEHTGSRVCWCKSVGSVQLK